MGNKVEKTINSLKIFGGVCGGWFGIMSGGLSIPFTLTAILYQGHEKGLFVMLAFISLFSFAIRVAWTNYQLKSQTQTVIQEAKLNLVNQHLEQRKRLEDVIGELTEKLKERSEADKLAISKQMAKEFVGYHLMALNNRLLEAKQISRYEFVDDVQKREWAVTKELFDKIEQSLTKHLTAAEAGLFQVARPNPIPEIPDDPYFGERRREWTWHHNFIVSKLNELKKIAEKL